MRVRFSIGYAIVVVRALEAVRDEIETKCRAGPLLSSAKSAACR